VNSINFSVTTEKLASGSGAAYAAPEQYPHRWWFDETYKDGFKVKPGTPCTTRAGNCGLWTGTIVSFVPNFVPNTKAWKRLGEGIFEGQWLPGWFRYWRDHDRPLATNPNFEKCRSCGSVNAYAFFPSNFDRASGAITARPVEAAKPGTDKAGRLTFGSLGSLPGQFFAPVDVETDADGNLYVIDSTTKKLQKFDKNGNFQASIDIRVNPGDTGEQSQPWGLAISPNGHVVVADTFGWRIRIFDTDLKDLGVTFGQPPDTSKTPGPFDLFGPRDAIIDRESILWVTDTGNERIVQYTLKGEYVRSIGSEGEGPGQFKEPVGLSLASDGTVYVADMYNSRVEILKADGSYSGEFKVEGWGGQDVSDKPYIRVLRDDRIALSLPNLHQVRIYDKSGRLLGTIAPTDEPLSRPYGLVETADGKLWIVEGGNARVRLFDIP
jgi:sugar lactone lactonase YvrE